MTPQPSRRFADAGLDDRLLIVRDAAGDPLDPSEQARLRDLLAASPELAHLPAELDLIARATAQAMTPARTRDFRLDAVDAQRLRPSALRRLLGRISAPSAPLLRPLAGATLAIGLVLVGAGAALPDAGEQNVGGETSIQSATFRLSSGQPYVAADASADAGSGNENASGAAVHAPELRSTAGPDDRQNLQTDGTRDPDRTIDTAGAVADPKSTSQPEETDLLGLERARQSPDSRSATVLVLGVLLSVVGAGVLVLAWFATRVWRDPLAR